MDTYTVSHIIHKFFQRDTYILGSKKIQKRMHSTIVERI